MPDIVIHTDTKTEKALKTLFSSYGLSVAEAVKLFFNKSIKDKEIPFEVQKKYNKRVEDSMKEAEEICKNTHLYKSYDNVDDIMTALLNEEDNKI